MPEIGSPVYVAVLLLAIGAGAVYWHRQARHDSRLPLVYAGGLAGAFLGAKLAYLCAEGWLLRDHPQRWLLWAAGKSVSGALPGGWLGVEAAKRLVGLRVSTGDRFVLLLPPALFFGRIGCLHAGCCRGVMLDHGGRWPAVEVEMGFQVVAFAVLWWWARRGWCRDCRFFAYLIAYGLFRFAHEFLRDTPKPFLGFSGYQIIALATAAAAAVGWRMRRAKAGSGSLQDPDCKIFM